MCISTPSPPKPYIPPAPPRYTDPNVMAAGEESMNRNRAAAGSASTVLFRGLQPATTMPKTLLGQ
jgi:hypothetical protein